MPELNVDPAEENGAEANEKRLPLPLFIGMAIAMFLLNCVLAYRGNLSNPFAIAGLLGDAFGASLLYLILFVVMYLITNGIIKSSQRRMVAYIVSFIILALLAVKMAR